MRVTGKNMVDVKQANRAAILTLLQMHGPMSRKRIASMLNLTPAAITTLVSDLQEAGLVKPLGEAPSPNGSKNVGRKEILLDLDGNEYFAAGISFDIGGATVSTVTLSGKIITTEKMIYMAGSDARSILQRACKFVQCSIQRQEAQQKICVGVGISVRGLVDECSNVCINSFGAWADENVPVQKLAEEYLPDYQIYVRQNLRALAETYLFDQQNEFVESALFIKDGTGIGSALIFDHLVYDGHRGIGSEVGHVTVDKGGKICRCGCKGCLETVSSCSSIERDVREIYSQTATPVLYDLTGGHVENVNIDDIVVSAECNDPVVVRILDNAIEKLAMVLRNMITGLGMQKVVLHGHIFHLSYFLEKLKESIFMDANSIFLDSVIETTENVQEMENKCSPVLAIKAFFERGGRLEKD